MNKCVCFLDERCKLIAFIAVNVCKRKAEGETSQQRRADEKISGFMEENESADGFGELL